MKYRYVVCMFLLLQRWSMVNCVSTACNEETLERIATANDNTSPINGTLHCPYISACTYDYSKSLTDSNVTAHKPCCTHCTTSDSCSMKCCPDITPCILRTTSHVKKETVCVPSVFKNTFYQKGLVVTATCNGDSDMKERAMCLQEYDYNNVGPIDVLPVTDEHSFEIYRNIHCAACNGLQRNQVRFWSVRVLCGSTSNVDFAQYSDILKVIKIDSCHIIYENPFPDAQIVICDNIISTCNVTGKATDPPPSYGRDKEICKQRPFTPIFFVTVFDMVFKNGACMRCNNIYMSSFPMNNQKPDFPALSLKLDYNRMAVVPETIPSTCPRGTIYFPTKDQCIEVRCSLIRRLQGNVCERALSSVEGFAYRLGVRTKIDAYIDVRTGSSLVTSIGKLIDNRLRQVFKEIDDILYEVLLVADANMTDGLSAEEIMETRLLFIEFRMKLKNGEMQDPELKLTEILSLFATKVFMIFVNQDLYTISLILKDDVIVDTYSFSQECISRFIKFETCVYQDSLNEIRVINTTGGYAAIPYHSKRTQSIILDEFYKHPIATERNIIELRNCPFVKVIKKQVPWIEVDFGVLFTLTGMFLPFSEFVYGDNDGEVWVCMDVYHALSASGDIPVLELVNGLISIIVWYLVIG